LNQSLLIIKENSLDMPVTLRPVTPEDEEFLLQLYASIRADELELAPWNDAQREAFVRMQFAAQQHHYRTHNPEATHDIILLDAQAIGRLYVARREREIRILDITILPEHRSKGIGTPLIKDLMTEATHAGLPLNIFVESFNPSHHLFERLGFSKVEEDGINHLMQWQPGA
jgi:N-acetylglutamate synthase-like GNAT family acetyltransferase